LYFRSGRVKRLPSRRYTPVAHGLDWCGLSVYDSSRRSIHLSSALRRNQMRHFVVLMLFASNSILFAAGSPDLLVATRNGDHAQVRKLIETGADVNTVDKDGTTALMHSVIESDVKMMKLLIDKRANVNTKNSQDSTALMYATTNLSKTRVLLDAVAEVKVRGKRG